MKAAWLLCAGMLLLMTEPSLRTAQAETLRIATFNIELTRDGPGLALRDIQSGTDAQVTAIVAVIAQVQPDILSLQGLDYDYGLETINALRNRLAQSGAAYSHVFARPTNRGLQTGLDMDGDGRAGEAADAQGFGRFYGQGAMALLSRFPIVADEMQDFTELLWSDLPEANLPKTADGTPFPTAEALARQRLSSSGHWAVPIQLPDASRLNVLAFHATPPVFDGPEDRNGRRNADEIRFWRLFLNGQIGSAPETPVVLTGSATLDPFDSDGRNEAIRDLLESPPLQDPRPESQGAATRPDEGHVGPNARDTVEWAGVGRLRVDYVLPGDDLAITGSGVFWPAPGEPGHDAAQTASRHRLVWVDVALPLSVSRK